MNKVYVIRCQELYSDGKTTSYVMHPAYTTYMGCYNFLERIIATDTDYYEDGGWERKDLEERLIWSKDPHETWVKWDFNDEYTIYYIEEMEVREEED